MAAVRMFIEKFGREVLIDEGHPLAVAQRAKGATAGDGSGTALPAFQPVVERTWSPEPAEEPEPVEDAPKASDAPAPAQRHVGGRNRGGR